MGEKENFMLLNILEIVINENRTSKLSSPEVGDVSRFVAGDFIGSFFSSLKKNRTNKCNILK